MCSMSALISLLYDDIISARSRRGWPPVSSYTSLPANGGAKAYANSSALLGSEQVGVMLIEHVNDAQSQDMDFIRLRMHSTRPEMPWTASRWTAYFESV